MANTAFTVLTSSRRPSRLGAALEARKLQDAHRLTPAERLVLALDLADLCREFERKCSPKR